MVNFDVLLLKSRWTTKDDPGRLDMKPQDSLQAENYMSNESDRLIYLLQLFSPLLSCVFLPPSCVSLPLSFPSPCASSLLWGLVSLVEGTLGAAHPQEGGPANIPTISIYSPIYIYVIRCTKLISSLMW